MTPSQQLNYEMQWASTEAEAFQVWTRHREQLKDASLILSVPGESPFKARLPKNLDGGGHLISTFANDELFFLNDQIHAEMEAGRKCDFRILYTISFDTNAASYLRGLIKGGNANAHKSLRKLLFYVYPHKLNWQVYPYLFENADSIVARRNDQFIFETILAAEKLQDIDIEHLRTTGELRLVANENEAISRTARMLSLTAQHLMNGTYDTVLERWQMMYVIVLFMTREQILNPGVGSAHKKLKALVRFMDEELHTMALELLFVAWNWFSGGKQTSIFNKLQRNAPNLLEKAQNISWDIFHIIQLRQEATFHVRDASFLVPFFLTFDQALADLARFCAIKSCLIPGTFHYPMSFTNQDPNTFFISILRKDEEFLERYFTVDANSRRDAWLKRHGLPNLSLLRQKLEKELLKLDS